MTTAHIGMCCEGFALCGATDDKPVHSLCSILSGSTKSDCPNCSGEVYSMYRLAHNDDQAGLKRKHENRQVLNNHWGGQQ